MKQEKKNVNIAKIGVIILGALFVISMTGSTLLSFVGRENIEVPTQQILSELLTPEQDSLVRNNYGVVIRLEYSQDDEGLVIMLESFVRQFPPVPVEGGLMNFVFLENLQTEETQIIVKARLEESFDEYNESAIIDAVCDGLHPQVEIRYDLCIIRDF